MGKKGSWISILKKAFTPKSKSKLKDDTGSENYRKEKQQQGLGRKTHSEVNSFIPLHREPSSIEKILGDVEKEQQYRAQQVSHQKVQQPKSTTRRQHTSTSSTKNVVSDKAETVSSDRKTTSAPYNTKSSIPSKQTITCNSKPVRPNSAQISAIKIQAAYRGYMVRKRFKALKSLLRLQNMMKGQNVKRQTMNTMRSMQLLVRIQTQIHARRLQMMEKQNTYQHQISWMNSNETFNSLSKWNSTNQLEKEAYDGWDDSMLTKEEIEASVKRKVEAVMKRERALAYAYSHKLLTITPKTAHSALTDARSGGYPLWWNWLERQIPSDSNHAKTPPLPTPRTSSATNAAGFSLQRPNSRSKPAKAPFDASTLGLSRPLHTYNSSNRWQAAHVRPVLRDDDSLTSCPAFIVPKSASGTSAAQVPNYMAPTVSAKAKVRSTAIEGGSGGTEGRRKFSFALSQSIGSLRLFSSKKEVAPATPQAKASGLRHRSTLSVGELSVDSTVSLPAGTLRRPFK